MPAHDRVRDPSPECQADQKSNKLYMEVRMNPIIPLAPNEMHPQVSFPSTRFQIDSFHSNNTQDKQAGKGKLVKWSSPTADNLFFYQNRCAFAAVDPLAGEWSSSFIRSTVSLPLVCALPQSMWLWKNLNFSQLQIPLRQMKLLTMICILWGCCELWTS